MASISYRSDIDGLRAIAVSTVVLNHAGAPGFSGGFVGVDIFFAISGFLITSILLAELRVNGRISFFDFYERRVRRILPALFVVLAATSVACISILPPADLKQYASSLQNTLYFASNIFFWNKTGYFAAPAATEPLLHTWSLAVEEQFYLLWPLTILFVHRSGRRWLLLVLAAASLALAQYQAQAFPEAGFYLLPARVCEFAAGAALAVFGTGYLQSTRLREALAVAGLIMIVLASATFTASTTFPGLNAMVPVAGAVMVMAGGPVGPVSWLLSTAAFRFVGQVSYSLYLWHWPVLVLPAIALGRPLSAIEAATAVAASLLLSAITWYAVEQPCRKRPATDWTKFRLSSAMWTSLGVTVAMLIAVAVVIRTDGLAFRGSADFARLEAAVADIDPLRLGKDCLKRKVDSDIVPCLYGNGPREVVMWGDSHANHFGPAFLPWATTANVSIQQVASPGCPPVTGVDLYINGKLDHTCIAKNQKVLQAVSGWKDVRIVILAARWSLYAETVRARAEASTTTHLARKGSGIVSVEEARLGLMAGLQDVIARLEAQGKQVVLVSQVPEYEFDPGKCLTRALWFAREPSCQQPRADAIRRLATSLAILRQAAAAHPNLRLIETQDAFCDATACKSNKDRSTPWYHDFDHLSADGARHLSDLVAQRLEGLPGK